jgi:hypothetical protein
MDTVTYRGAALFLLCVLLMMPGCATRSGGEPANPVLITNRTAGQAVPTEISGASRPVPTEIAGTTKPIPIEIATDGKPLPTQVIAMPPVQLAGTPTVHIIGSQAMKAERQNWEYSVFEAGPDMGMLVEQLNQLGQQGWEVTAELPGGRSSTLLLLKRPL